MIQRFRKSKKQKTKKTKKVEETNEQEALKTVRKMDQKLSTGEPESSSKSSDDKDQTEKKPQPSSREIKTVRNVINQNEIQVDIKEEN